MSVDFPLWGKCKYTGEVNSRDQPHGLGTAVVSNGWRFEGTYQDGSLVTGKMFMRDGSLMYEGEWKGGRAHGTGTAFNRDGTVLTGRWEENSFKDGTCTFPDGTAETGRYEEGSLIDGTVTCPDGRVVQVVNGERV